MPALRLPTRFDTSPARPQHVPPPLQLPISPSHQLNPAQLLAGAPGWWRCCSGCPLTHARSCSFISDEKEQEEQPVESVTAW